MHALLIIGFLCATISAQNLVPIHSLWKQIDNNKWRTLYALEDETKQLMDDQWGQQKTDRNSFYVVDQQIEGTEILYRMRSSPSESQFYILALGEKNKQEYINKDFVVDGMIGFLFTEQQYGTKAIHIFKDKYGAVEYSFRCSESPCQNYGVFAYGYHKKNEKEESQNEKTNVQLLKKVQMSDDSPKTEQSTTAADPKKDFLQINYVWKQDISEVWYTKYLTNQELSHPDNAEWGMLNFAGIPFFAVTQEKRYDGTVNLYRIRSKTNKYNFKLVAGKENIDPDFEIDAQIGQLFSKQQEGSKEVLSFSDDWGALEYTFDGECIAVPCQTTGSLGYGYDGEDYVLPPELQEPQPQPIQKEQEDIGPLLKALNFIQITDDKGTTYTKYILDKEYDKSLGQKNNGGVTPFYVMNAKKNITGAEPLYRLVSSNNSNLYYIVRGEHRKVHWESKGFILDKKIGQLFSNQQEGTQKIQIFLDANNTRQYAFEDQCPFPPCTFYKTLGYGFPTPFSTIPDYREPFDTVICENQQLIPINYLSQVVDGSKKTVYFNSGEEVKFTHYRWENMNQDGLPFYALCHFENGTIPLYRMKNVETKIDFVLTAGELQKSYFIDRDYQTQKLIGYLYREQKEGTYAVKSYKDRNNAPRYSLQQDCGEECTNGTVIGYAYKSDNHTVHQFYECNQDMCAIFFSQCNFQGNYNCVCDGQIDFDLYNNQKAIKFARSVKIPEGHELQLQIKNKDNQFQTQNLNQNLLCLDEPFEIQF